MSAPINVFKSFAYELTGGEVALYQPPPNNTAIVLMAQVSNNNPQDNTDLNVPDPNNARVDVGVQLSGGASRYLAKNRSVASETSLSLLSGKLVLTDQDSLVGALSGTPGDNSQGVHLILSILEARNA